MITVTDTDIAKRLADIVMLEEELHDPLKKAVSFGTPHDMQQLQRLLLVRCLEYELKKARVKAALLFWAAHAPDVSEYSREMAVGYVEDDDEIDNLFEVD